MGMHIGMVSLYAGMPSLDTPTIRKPTANWNVY